MNFPLKQYRQLLLIPAFLCTLSLLLFTAIKVSATELREEVSIISTYSSTSLPSSISPSFTKNLIPDQSLLEFPQRSVRASTTQLPELSIQGDSQTLFRNAVKLTASVTPPTGMPASAVHPVGYQWEPGDDSPVTIRFNSNGITSTALITWFNAGHKVINVIANTALGTVTGSYTVAVSAQSIAISSMQTTTFAYNEFDGTSIRVLVPAQNVEGSVQLDYLPGGEIIGPAQQGFLGSAFELNAIRNQRVQANYQFAMPTTLNIVYGDNNLGPDNGLSLELRRWNGSDWVSVASECGSSTVALHESAENRFVVDVCRLGQFAFFGATNAIFLPMLH